MAELIEPPRRVADSRLLGSLPTIRKGLLEFLTNTAENVGDVAGYRLGPRQVVLVSHPQLIEQILVHDNRSYHKHYALRFLQPLLGNGLLNSEDDFWLGQRRLMQPEFARARLESYGANMVARTMCTLESWKAGETRDLHGEMMRLTLAIVAKALLDVEVAAEAFAQVEQSLEVVLDDFRYRFEAAVPVPNWVPSPHNLRVNRAVRTLRQIVAGIIAQKRQLAEPGHDLLSRLILARHHGTSTGMTDKQLLDEVMTLFLAGHETTAVALTWTWYLLALHPDIEEQLHAELHHVLGDRAASVADLPALKFTECIVKEAMRLFPPVYAIGRMPRTDVQIGKYRVRRGTAVVMPQWVVHRDQRWWPDPLTFNPRRWLDAQPVSKYAYFPFGGGPRVCIGNQFAMIEAMLVVATIAQRFRFRLPPAQAITPWPTVTLRPRQGLPMELLPRSAGEHPTATQLASPPASHCTGVLGGGKSSEPCRHP